MGYYLRATIGVVLTLAGYALFAVALAKLIQTGTCASGGPYEIARECPDGTGKWAAALPIGIFTGLIGLAVFAFRGTPPSGKRRDFVSGFGSGVAIFGLFFFATGLVALFAEFGPGHSNGSHLGGAIVAATFIPMGLVALAIAFWMRPDRSERDSKGASSAATAGATAAGGPAPSGFSDEGLRKLSEMQSSRTAGRPAPNPAAPLPPPVGTTAEPVRLKRSGSALIESFKYLGESDAEGTLVEFELEVSAGGVAPYTVVHRQMVPLTRTAKLAQGATLRVLIERDNPAELEIDW